MPKIIFTGLFQEKAGISWQPKYCEQLASYLATKGYIIDFLDLSPIEDKMKLPKYCSHEYVGSNIFLPWKHPSIDKKSKKPIWADSNIVDYVKRIIGIVSTANIFKTKVLNDHISLIINYNGTLSIQRVCKYIAAANGIPQLFLSASVLPGTIEIDSIGTQALNWTVHNSHNFNKLLLDNNDLENAKNYINYITRKHEIIRLKKFDEIEEIKAKIQNDKKPVLFFAGSGKYGNGIWPRLYPASFYYSPFYKNDYDALSKLLKLANRNNWYILFKPHPVDPPQVVNAHPNLLIIKDLNRENILECISLSDAVITLVSSVSGLGLIYGKPVVLLGRNTLTGKKIAYELNTKDNLQTIIKSALDSEFTSQMKDNWLQYVARTLKYHVFSCDSNVDRFTGGGVEKAGEFIIQHCVRNKP